MKIKVKILLNSFGWDNIVNDLLRYGQYEVVKYVFGKFGSIILKNNYNHILIDQALYNSDDRIIKFILDKVEKLDNSLIVSFLGVKKISDKTKIRKLRILSKKFDLVNEIDNIIASSIVQTQI